MNPEFETYELIDRYLNKQLSGAELDAFRARMLMDQDFSELVENQKMANELIISEQLIGLKQRIKTDLDSGKGSSGISAGLAGLVLLGLIGAGTGAYLYTQKDDNIVAVQQNEKTVLLTNTQTINTTSETPVKQKTTSKTEVKNADKTIEIIPQENTPEVAKPVEIETTTPVTSQQQVTIPAIKHQEEKPVATEKQVPVTLSETPVLKKEESKTEATPSVTNKKTDEVFMPGHGEMWKVPLDEHTSATIRFFSKAGAVQREVHVGSGEDFEWDGRGNNGEEIQSGRYLFVVEYADGKQQKGYISLIR